MGPGMFPSGKEWAGFLLLVMLLGAGCNAACMKACGMFRVKVERVR